MVSQARHAIQRLFGVLLPVAKRLLGLAQLFVQAFNAGVDGRFVGIGGGIHAAADHLCAPLDFGPEVGLIHAGKSVTQLRGRRALARGKIARSVLHLLFQAGQVVGQALTVGGKFCQFVEGGLGLALCRSLGHLRGIERPPHALGLVALLPVQAFALASQ